MIPVFIFYFLFFFNDSGCRSLSAEQVTHLSLGIQQVLEYMYFFSFVIQCSDQGQRYTPVMKVKHHLPECLNCLTGRLSADLPPLFLMAASPAGEASLRANPAALAQPGRAAVIYIFIYIYCLEGALKAESWDFPPLKCPLTPRHPPALLPPARGTRMVFT